MVLILFLTRNGRWSTIAHSIATSLPIISGPAWRGTEKVQFSLSQWCNPESRRCEGRMLFPVCVTRFYSPLHTFFHLRTLIGENIDCRVFPPIPYYALRSSFAETESLGFHI